MANIELDYMEYANDTAAQAAYVTSDIPDIDSYAKLASSFDGDDAATAYTDPVAGAYTFVGTAQLDTAQKKFGTASLLLDGNSDYVTLPDSANWSFGSGDFTIDVQVRYNSLGGGASYQPIVGQYVDGTHFWVVYYRQDIDVWAMLFSDGTTKGYVYATAGAAINTWYHVAFVRSGSNAYIFKDGVSLSLTSPTPFGSNDVGDLASTLSIGYNQILADYHNGWIDEPRVSKGIARWTADFTPPAKAYSASSSLQSYSEATIKQQGSYSLKGIAT